MSFQDLGLSPVLLRALDAQGHTTPTPIQVEAIPPILAGRDIMASAPTGTGKTAAFALPLLQRLFPQHGNHDKPSGKRPRALVLTPTRELANQVHASVRACGKGLPLRSCAIFGGTSMQRQLQALQRGLDVVVATPGRLIDHLERGSIELHKVEVLVLDEADRMLDMGFAPALKKIIARLPRQRQTLMFSATFAGPIKELAEQLLHNPAKVQVTPPNSVAATVTHHIHPVDAGRKRELLLHILAEDSRRQTLVFGRTKHGADKLVRFLENSGLRAAAIHGNKSQAQRQRALQRFKDGRVTVLVATDVASRGLDIPQLPLVINHDLPMVAEDYVHRIGRTGRAGLSGVAVSLVSQGEVKLLRDIQKIVKNPLDMAPVEGFEPEQPLRMDAKPSRAAAKRPRPYSKAGKPPRRGRNGQGDPRATHGARKHATKHADKRGPNKARRNRRARPA